MFKIKKTRHIIGGRTMYAIEDERGYCLHDNGDIFYDCREYWPTRELAQAVLDKWQHQRDKVDALAMSYGMGKVALTTACEIGVTAFAKAYGVGMARQVVKEATRKARIKARKVVIRAADVRAAMEAYQARKPEHVWVHGDVFKSSSGVACMYFHLNRLYAVPMVFTLDGNTVYHKERVSSITSGAAFLFNIREKL